jgi:adenosylhomocysteine nucleosidase
MSRRINSVSIGALATQWGVVHAAAAVGRQWGPATDADARRHADIGVLTVLREEIRAVVGILQRHENYRTAPLPGGPQVHRADVAVEGGALHVVALQTLEPGPQSAAAAYHLMRSAFRPPVVLLVGIAGGIRADVAVGDVVVSDEIICYDARRETPSDPRRRGKSHAMTPAMRFRVNEFFRRNGPVVSLHPGGSFRVFRGPVGSGAAVLTSGSSDIREFLRRFNENTLAVETEASGVGQAFYEEMSGQQLTGWLTIRGISDLASRSKTQDCHQLASDHAAVVMDRLLPLLGRAGRPAAHGHLDCVPAESDSAGDRLAG